MARSINDLGESMLAQLFEIATGGDDEDTLGSNFISWCQPGIPFGESDFDFAVGGLGSGATAEKNKLLLQQAFNFSQAVDFIPSSDGLYKDDQQQAIFSTSGARLSHMYGEILRASKVTDEKLSDKQIAKLEKFRDMLFEIKETVDIVTDEVSKETVPTAVMRAYTAAQDEWIDAALAFNNAQVQAESATGPEGSAAVANFSINAEILRTKVKRARAKWETGGHKSDIDKINAFIAQTTGRSMLLWKQRLIEYWEASFRTALGQGARFFYAAPIPGNFAKAKGWTKYTVYHTETSSTASKKRKNWKAGGGVNFGLYRAGAQGAGSSSKETGDFSVSDFKLEFEFAQVLISRPGLYPEFFMNRGWHLDPGKGWNFAEMPSDGSDPPNGLFVAYPTQMLMVKNVKITSKEFVSKFEKFSKEIEGSGSVGWGPFKVKGGAGQSEEGTETKSTSDGSSLMVEGMQIIGFKNHKFGKAPNLLEGINMEDLV